MKVLLDCGVVEWGVARVGWYGFLTGAFDGKLWTGLQSALVESRVRGQVVWEWGGRTEMTRGQEVCGGENGENPPQFVETKKIKRYLCPLKTTKPHNDIQQ